MRRWSGMLGGRIRIGIAVAVAIAGLTFTAAPPAQAKDRGSDSITCLFGQTNQATVTIAPNNLWPPNHKMRNITLSVSLDNDSQVPVPFSLTIDSLSSDQQLADDGGHNGCGQPTAKQGKDTSPEPPVTQSDTLQSKSDVLTLPIMLRGERCARIGPRTYEVAFHCCDNSDAQNPICDAGGSDVLEVHVQKKNKK